MKTSLVYSYGTGRYRRAALPTDPEDARKMGEARFVAAHSGTVDRVVSLTPYRTRRGVYHAPDGVRIPGGRHEFKRGVCPFVRHAPADCVDRLDALDREIAALEAERRAVIEDAYVRGTPIRVSDLTVEAAP